MATKVTKTEAKKTVKRYGDAERMQLLDKYHALRKEGKNAAVAAEELSVPYITLRTWEKAIEVKAAGKKKAAKVAARGAKAKKKAKTVKRAPVSGGVVLVLPDGTRVECARAEDAVQFIKANR
jgi:hypothetical protein